MDSRFHGNDAFAGVTFVRYFRFRGNDESQDGH
jgi:hypothetical protein